MNVHYMELVAVNQFDQLLSNQITRLLVCLDVYLETDSQRPLVAGSTLQHPLVNGANEFEHEKMCPRLTR